MAMFLFFTLEGWETQVVKCRLAQPLFQNAALIRVPSTSHPIFSHEFEAHRISLFSTLSTFSFLCLTHFSPLLLALLSCLFQRIVFTTGLQTVLTGSMDLSLTGTTVSLNLDYNGLNSRTDVFAGSREGRPAEEP